MYNFVTGPLAWFSFLVFFIGLFVRSVLYIKGLDSNLDRVTYKVNTGYGIKPKAKAILQLNNEDYERLKNQQGKIFIIGGKFKKAVNITKEIFIAEGQIQE